LGLASYSSDVDIFNQSFSSSSTQLPPQVNSYNAINNNALGLRGGKGAIFVQSAGNSFSNFGSFASVCDQAKSYGVSCGSAASDTRREGTLTIVVGATAADGTKSSYSNAGSSLWVAAPGGEYGMNSSYAPGASGLALKPAIITTSLSGCNNYSSQVNALDSRGANALAAQCQYTAIMNGTSSAAPNLSGVIALMLHANPLLGYRDVKNLLARTSKKTDATRVGVTTNTLISGTPVTLDQGWVRNSAGYWFSNWYGFGAIDAAAAVNAVATIGYSNEPFRPKCIGALQRLKARAKTIDGFFFVESMIDNQLENLTGGGIGGQINKGRGGADTGAKSSLERQFSQAAMGGFLGNTSPPPPVEDDWMSGIEVDDTQAKGKVVAGAKASATSYAKNKKPWDV
jgi:hypothetical protein